MLLDSILAVRFPSTAATKSTSVELSFIHRLPEPSHRRILHFNSNRRSHSLKSRFTRSTRTGAAEQSPESVPRPPVRSYHPLEEIGESLEAGDAKPTAAEIARTLVEVNGKATLMFTGMMEDQFHDSVYWPDLAYLTDEHGNMYFEMKDDEDILQTLTNENNYVQVIIGLDTFDMLNEMELGPSDIDFGFEEIVEEVDDDEDEEDDIDENDDYENDWIVVLDDEEDGMDSDRAIGDWSKLATTRSSHPMYFAKRLSEAASDNSAMDYMDQSSPGLCIQGPLRPAIIEESCVIRKHVLDCEPPDEDTDDIEKVSNDLEDRSIHAHDLKSAFTSASRNGSVWAKEMDKNENLRTGSSFYKLEMIKIQLISPHRDRAFVEINDFQKAEPDVIAHSAFRIISRMKAGGDKFVQALKSLCWRVKSIQVEEAILTGVDCLGFDLRVCSGKQVQNLRFAFISKANSEYSAERQLHDLIYPRIHQKPQKRQEAHTKEL